MDMTEDVQEIPEDKTEYYEKLRDPKFKERFEQKFRKNKAGCWIWTASRDKDDYGQIRVGKGVYRAHRVAYELYTGEVIPPNMDIDHTCHIRRCVNIDHHEVVEHKENMQNLRKTEDWEVSEEEFHKKKTTPEIILDEAVAIIERSDVRRLFLTEGGTYEVQSVDTAPWRDIKIERGRVAQDKMSPVKMFLEAVSMGADWKLAAERILEVSPFTVINWTRYNLLFREDLNAAKKAGRKTRMTTLEDMHMDEMERKIEFADFKDISTSFVKLREQDEERIAAKKQQQDNGLPNITIVFGDNPRKALETLIEVSEELEAEYEVIEPKTLKEG